MEIAVAEIDPTRLGFGRQKFEPIFIDLSDFAEPDARVEVPANFKRFEGRLRLEAEYIRVSQVPNLVKLLETPTRVRNKGTTVPTNLAETLDQSIARVQAGINKKNFTTPKDIRDIAFIVNHDASCEAVIRWDPKTRTAYLGFSGTNSTGDVIDDVRILPRAFEPFKFQSIGETPTAGAVAVDAGQMLT